MKIIPILFSLAFLAGSGLAQESVLSDPTPAGAPESTSLPTAEPEPSHFNTPAAEPVAATSALPSATKAPTAKSKKHRPSEWDDFDPMLDLKGPPGPHSVVMELTSVLVPLAFFGTVVLIVGSLFYLRYRQKVSLHNTIRALLEKGIDIPPALLTPTPPPLRRRSDLRRGVFWVALGLGLIGFFLAVEKDGLGLGLIPLCIGAAYLVVWKLESRNDQPK